MPLALDTPRLAANALASPVGVELVAKARGGRFHGQPVVVDDAKLSPLNPRLHAYAVQRMSLQRRMVLAKRKGQASGAEAAARIAEFYDKLPDMPGRAELQRLVETLHKRREAMREKEKAKREEDEGAEGDDGDSGGARRRAKNAIFAALQAFDPDLSHQFAALEIARGQLASGGASDDDPQFLAALDEAAEFFNDTEIARDVRAGMAAARAANAAAATLATNPAAVRDAYRAMIREQRNFGQLFDALIKFDPLKHCEAVIETFRAAAGADLRSLTGPSTDPQLLQSLLSELGKLKKLRTVLEGSERLTGNAKRVLPDQDKEKLDATGVASRMLHFVSKSTVAFHDARALLGPLEQGRPETKVVFVNGANDLLGLVPDDVFPTMQARLMQKDALKTLSARLVEEEEREFEQKSESASLAGKRPGGGAASQETRST